ncbi:1431_t:CDS:2, partial [Acaulospora morrowiae]
SYQNSRFTRDEQRKIPELKIPTNFSSLGIREPICQALENKFNIRKPTECQASLIPNILRGKDVLIRDITGSGKTFGIALALLNKTRNQQTYDGRSSRIGKPCITSLLVVPSRELAHQIENWIRVLLSNTGLPLKPVIQAVVRADPQEEHQQLDNLENIPPHILVGTATRLHDLANDGYLNFRSLKTFVLDEADHLLRLPPKHATLKKIQSRQIHPKPAELLTQHVFSQVRPQIVVSSATLNRALRYYFKDNKYSEDPVFIDVSKGTLSPSTIEHHCLLISTKEIKNITSAEFHWYNPFTDSHLPELKEDIRDDDDLMLDSLVGTFEFENVKCGIIFVNNQIKLPNLIKRLLKYGVEAKELENSHLNQEETKCKLFVAHEFT